MNTAQKVIDIALAEVGYLEKSRSAYVGNPACIWYKIDGAGYDNYTKYAYRVDQLNWYAVYVQGAPWCATFVDDCMIQAYGEPAAARMKNHGIYDSLVDCAIDQYKAAGQWYREPKPGDQIFFSKSNGVDPAHTGLVIAVDDDYVHTVEGNTDSQDGNVESNGGGVFRKKYRRNYYRILGYGRPLYDEEDDDYMTRDEILKELGDKWIATYDELPAWAKPIMRKLLDEGIINGGTDASVDPDDINMYLSDIKTIIVNYRMMHGNE